MMEAMEFLDSECLMTDVPCIWWVHFHFAKNPGSITENDFHGRKGCEVDVLSICTIR